MFGVAAKRAGAGTPVYRQCLNPGLLGDRGNLKAIPVLRIPAGANLQRHRHIHRVDHGFENATDQRLVTQQRGPGHDIADLFGRATHIDIDDLCALLDIEAGRRRHLHGIGTGYLHRDRRSLACVVDAAACLAAAPEQRIGRHHFGYRQTGTQGAAQLPERAIGNPGHRCQYQLVRKFVGAYFHRTYSSSIGFRRVKDRR